MDDNPWGTPAKVEVPNPDISVLTIIETSDEIKPEEREETTKTTTTTIAELKSDEVVEEVIPSVVNQEAGEFTERIEELTVPRRLSVAAELPPMDEFPTTPSEEPTTFNVSAAIPETTVENEGEVDDGFDDFADFGEGGEGGDFGSFGGDDEDEFSLPPLSSFSPTQQFTELEPEREIPIASTSTARYRALDLSNPTVEGLRPQLLPFLEKLYPSSGNSLTDEHERQIDGVAQVLVTEGLRTLLVNLSSLPPLKPLDWRRSRIRREQLITLGIPINLDDSPDARPLASLVLPSQLKFSPPPLAPSPLAPSPSPSSATSIPNRIITASPLPSRSSTPNPSVSSPSSYRNPINPAPAPPPLDVIRANEICNYQELDLSLLSLEQLRGLKDEMEQLRLNVSNRLAFELGVREREVGDGETYHSMIQDLVTAASKMKTTRGTTTISRSNSGKWGRKTSK